MKKKKLPLDKNKSHKSLPLELFQLEDSVGQFMQYWGFKKIHGRIWTHLYLSSEPLDTEELMQRLKVSKGLMSLAMRDLVHYEVIQQTATGKHGTVFYTANEDLQNVIFNVLKTREKKMLQLSQSWLEKLNKIKPAELKKQAMSLERIQSALELTTSAKEILELFLGQSECDSSEIFSTLSVTDSKSHQIKK